MGAEGAGGFADIGGVFHGDDGDFVGGAAGRVGEQVAVHFFIVQCGEIGKVFLGFAGVSGVAGD